MVCTLPAIFFGGVRGAMAASPWQPREFVRFEENFTTSTHPARIVTDAGPAFIKVINNPIGPHALVREFVGTSLAHWLGLETLEFALMQVTKEDEIPLPNGALAVEGTAFVTRAVSGQPWSGDPKELMLLDNLDSISRLVVFDTWTLNADRHPPDTIGRKPKMDNVFFSADGATAGRFRLLAIDHTECFGGTGRDLGGGMATIDRIREEHVYGLFPEFKTHIKATQLTAVASRLAELDQTAVEQIIDRIPADWGVSPSMRASLTALIVDRARYLSDRIVALVTQACGRLAV
jgi:HipA-like protein